MYTYFDTTRKVLCVIQVVEDASGSTVTRNSVMGHTSGEEFKPYTDEELAGDETLESKNEYKDSVIKAQD